MVLQCESSPLVLVVLISGHQGQPCEQEAVTRMCEFAFRSNFSPWTTNTDWVHKAGYPSASLRLGSCVVECVCTLCFLFKEKGCWLSVYRQVETLTQHVHGHFGLHRPELGGVLGMTCQLPPVISAQSGDPLGGSGKTNKMWRTKDRMCIITLTKLRTHTLL